MARRPKVGDYAEFIECRSYMHAWRHKSWHLFTGKRTPKFRSPHAELVDEIECGRCGSIRMDRYLVRRGRVDGKIGSHRVYPDGYLVPGGRLTRAAFVAHMAAEGLTQATVVNLDA